MLHSNELLGMILKFHDGREKAIPLKRMAIFEDESVYNRLYRGKKPISPR